jgi:hypothetical protein
MGCHPSHWRTHIFQDDSCTTNQISNQTSVSLSIFLEGQPHSIHCSIVFHPDFLWLKPCRCHDLLGCCVVKTVASPGPKALTPTQHLRSSPRLLWPSRSGWRVQLGWKLWWVIAEIMMIYGW